MTCDYEYEIRRDLNQAYFFEEDIDDCIYTLYISDLNERLKEQIYQIIRNSDEYEEVVFDEGTMFSSYKYSVECCISSDVPKSIIYLLLMNNYAYKPYSMY